MAPIKDLLNTTATKAMSARNNNTIQNATETQENYRAFTTTIQVVHTVALGVLIVLALVTLFHCRDQSKATSAAKSADEKLTKLCQMVAELKAKVMEGEQGTRRSEAVRKDWNVEGGDLGENWKGDVKFVDEKRASGVGVGKWEGDGVWEVDVLARLKGIWVG